MTERSYFWAQDAPPVGDAIYSPYNAEEFTAWFASPVVSNSENDYISTQTDYCFVVPGYLDNLRIIPNGDGTRSVSVLPGAAFIHDYLYMLDVSKTLSIATIDSTKYRIDSIILRLKDDKVRLAVLSGAPTTGTPAKPAVTQTPGTWEVEIATVYVNGTDTYIQNKNIEDHRKFLYNHYSRATQPNACYNLLKGSEWLSFSGASGGTGYAPDMWSISGNTFTGYSFGAQTPGTGRGDSIALDGGNGTISQWVAAGAHKTFTVEGGFYTDGGTVLIGLRGYRADGAESTTFEEVEYPSPSALTYHPVNFTITFPEDDIAYLYFYIAITGSSDTDLRQFILYPGFHTGYFHQIDEIVMFNKSCVDASWTATAKSTGTTTINLGAGSFPVSARVYTKALVLRVRGRDSGSGAGAPYMNIQGYAAPFNEIYGTLELQGITNDTWEDVFVVVPVNQQFWGTGTGGLQFRVNISATGAGTFDATIEIVGIIS